MNQPASLRRSYTNSTAVSSACAKPPPPCHCGLWLWQVEGHFPHKRLREKKKGRHPRRTSPPTINPPNQERSFLRKTTKTLESPRTFVRLPSANASVEHWHLSPCPLFFGVSWGSAVNDVWVILEIWPPKKKTSWKTSSKTLPQIFFANDSGECQAFFMSFNQHFALLLFFNVPASSKGCQLNPKGWWIDTL